MVYLFKNRDVPVEEGDLNCDGSVDIADVVYLFRNYRRFRSPVVFAEKFTLKPHWDEGYCYLEDSRGTSLYLLQIKVRRQKSQGLWR